MVVRSSGVDLMASMLRWCAVRRTDFLSSGCSSKERKEGKKAAKKISPISTRNEVDEFKRLRCRIDLLTYFWEWISRWS